jgi:hypothetical protein
MPEAAQIAPDVRASLERLVASPAMARAPRVHAVLKFLVDELLAGRADGVNEQRIGEGAFGRNAGYNPAEDNIVRVTVGHLRTRLDEYYRAEGQREGWILEIPKGRYVPVVHQRESSPEGALAGTATEPSVGSRPTGKLLIPVLVILLAVASAGIAYLLYERSKPPNRPAGGLLALLFEGRTTPITLVVSDENLMAYRYMFGKTVPLTSYLGLQYAAAGQGSSPTELKALDYARLRQSTSTASAAVAVALHGALQPYGVKVRHPAELSTPDVQNDSIIMLGGPWVNPWVQLFEDKLTFRTYPPPGQVISEIHNAHPGPGEREVYAAHSENGIEVSYVRVAVRPTASGKGHVVLIGGIRGPSQEAGCDLILNSAKTGEVLKRLGATDVAHLPPFELLLEVRGVSHTPLDTRIIAHRIEPKVE